ncbi:unnamed protein product [Schistocephalus solidus]|uniref:Activated CDC42 kinase 1 n=1 Tax=Schistocephalus solidus TaxID=70667 RepID=A0A183SF67_SCHSO|nr:unnamed protein product [Schistocephalus solidus]
MPKSAFPAGFNQPAALKDERNAATVSSTGQSNDCSFRFNRAKSHFFHSCRYPKTKIQAEKQKRDILEETTQSLRCGFGFLPFSKSRHSIISETDTIASTLDDGDGYEPDPGESLIAEGQSSSRFYSSQKETPMSDFVFFNDSMTEDLYEELPAPPPPPRISSPCLKPVPFAYQKDKLTSTSVSRSCHEGLNTAETQCISSQTGTKTNETIPKSGLSASTQVDVPSEFLEDDAYLDYSCDVRIYPVLQNGVKMSDTHYWILNPPKSSIRHRWRNHSGETMNLAHVSVSAPKESCEDKLPDGWPSSFSAKLMAPPQYVNLSSSSSVCSSPGNKEDTLHLGYNRKQVALRRGRSENSKEFLQKVQRNLVEKLRLLVPSATENECQAVLIGSSWSFEDALKRLKLELICRTGYASKLRCQRLLESLDWDFDAAMRCALESRPIEQRVGNLRHYTPDQAPYAPTSVSPFSSAPLIKIRGGPPNNSPKSSAGEEIRTPDCSPTGLQNEPLFSNLIISQPHTVL